MDRENLIKRYCGVESVTFVSSDEFDSLVLHQAFHHLCDTQETSFLVIRQPRTERFSNELEDKLIQKFKIKHPPFFESDFKKGKIEIESNSGVIYTMFQDGKRKDFLEEIMKMKCVSLYHVKFQYCSREFQKIIIKIFLNKLNTVQIPSDVMERFYSI
ncbi:hypothetical protein [Armatimonas rosea]|uniref:Uncharacterized protein n=1 Tax=Armatimonas rosea TaxID=685828 RepID=A0A7W9SSR6_ARMRO|nr:hypothetical protein [Armatimonas rosea]MBB6052166.1 hypothetical protein [Armatimonas rosea]